ncbi:MAG: thiopeptide-type bacteriocin biosynthesis protein, partial [Verrucomicrobia bacterium]|nr:thiopeptide-type bacteriocin biosynthesis protein [Verrucomicrobiota bacterium]
MTQNIYKAAPFFTLRTPAWAIEDLSHINLNDRQLLEAIPNLRCRNPKRLEKTILNYAKRMATRTTPFGKFAGVMHGRFADKSDEFLDLSKLCFPEPVVLPLNGPYIPNSLLQLKGERYFLGRKSIRASALHKGNVQTLLQHRFLVPANSPLTSFNATHSSPIFHLSKSIAEEVEKQVGKIATQRPLKGYLRKFLERFGIYRTIPLMQLFREIRWEREEIVSEETEAPYSLDVFCKVFDDSVQITQIHCMGGSSMGRFLNVLGVDAKNDLQQFFEQEEALDPTAQFVEISYWPEKGAEIAAIPCLRKRVFDNFSDLYVGATEERFYLTTKEGKCEIIPRAGHRLNPDNAPEPIRFMFEIHRTMAFEQPHEGKPWLKSERGHHFCEIVVPMLRRQPSKSIVARPHMIVPFAERWKFPGDEWFYVKFYTEDIDHFLIHYLAPFAQALGVEWYFLRYERHLRFRAKVSSCNVPKAWMEDGVIQNMEICCYEREIERYGGMEGIVEAEKIFCWDTKRVIKELQSKREGGWEALSVIGFAKSLRIEIPDVGHKHLLKGFREHKTRLLKSSIDVDPYPFCNPGIGDSLLHMHCNRLGCDEMKAYVWARHMLNQPRDRIGMI